MSLQRGSEYENLKMQDGATGTGDGTPYLPIGITRGNYNLLTLQVVGIGTGTIVVEGTIDRVNWATLPVLAVTTATIQLAISANGIYRTVVTGLTGVRSRIDSYGSGTIYVHGVMSATGEVGLSGTISSGVPASTANLLQWVWRNAAP